jgi:hypothetical protein
VAGDVCERPQNRTEHHPHAHVCGPTVWTGRRGHQFLLIRVHDAKVDPILRYGKEDQPTNDKEEEQIDYFWSKLSAEPRAEQCGWLKDRFGLSWQIVPTAIDEMLGAKDPAKLVRVTETFLKMREFDIAKLKHAYSQGKSAA